MGYFRFRRSIGNKFLRLNISKTGFSVTGGMPGAHVNADLSNRRKKMFMSTFGIPGSGLSYRTGSYGRSKKQGGDGLSGLLWVIGIITLIVLFHGG